MAYIHVCYPFEFDISSDRHINWAVFLVLTRLIRVTNATAPQTWPAGHAQLQFVENVMMYVTMYVTMHVMMYVTMYICNDACVYIEMKCGTLTHSPVDWYGHQSEHRRTDTQHGNKLRYLAVELAKYPVAVQHIVIVEGHVQTGDHRIGYGQVHWEEYTKSALISESSPKMKQTKHATKLTQMKIQMANIKVTKSVSQAK